LEGGRSAIRLTVGSYRRPSGKEIHKWKSSQDSDEWGVRPDPGLEVPLTNHQNDVILAARRKRDFISWNELEGTNSSPDPAPLVTPNPTSSPPEPPQPLPDDPKAPMPDGDAPPPAAQQAPAIEAEAAAAARHDPAAIDPQLKKAIDYLEQEIKRRPQAPGRA
jgi:carboxyl-terminal processing protease